MKRIVLLCAAACVLMACNDATDEPVKTEPAEMPGEIAEQDGKGDWRTDYYTDVRGELQMNDTRFDTYQALWPNYYFGYTVELEAGDIVDLRAGEDDGYFDPVMGLYGPQAPSGDWGQLVAANDDTPEGGSFDSYIQWEAAETGTYLILVREYDWYSGDLWVSATCAGGPCEQDQCGEVMCTLYCPNGFETDENGCEICSCAGEDPICPTSTPEPNEVCAQVIAWGKDPNTGECCQYPSPCYVPDGWDEYYSEAACLGPAQEGENCELYGRQCAQGLECEYQCPDGSNDPNCNLGINPSGVCVPSQAECTTDSDCFETGCSGQVCAAESVITTCEWRAEYACYNEPTTSCGCNEGTCEWAQTAALSQCLGN